MSTSQAPNRTEHWTSPCHHGVDLSENLYDRIMRESPSKITLTQSTPDLKIIHSLPSEISRFLDQSDYSTLLHSVRVSMMSRIGAQIMSYDKWEQDKVELSGLAHDIGKQIPEVHDIVHNGRPLTAAERAVVNRHAQYGFEILYNSYQIPQRGIRNRLGNFMGHVALDVLFSHNHAKAISQRGVSHDYLANLVLHNVITEDDANNHIAQPSAQLVAIADVTDALLSSGMERAYRMQRLRQEGRPILIDPEALPEVVADMIDVPAIDIEKVVPELTSRYAAIEQQAEHYAQFFQSRQTG